MNKEERFLKSTNICEKMNQVRKEYGDSLRFLSQELNCCFSSVSKYNSGDVVPPARYIYDFCRYYGVSADWLFGLTKKEEVKK